MAGLNAHQFPEVYEDLGISLDTLGCIMLSVSSLRGLVQPENGLNREDLYYARNPDHFWIDGAVAEKAAGAEPGWAGAHLTLLYGLIARGHHDPSSLGPIAPRPKRGLTPLGRSDSWGIEREHVDAVMEGWEPPLALQTHHIEVFPSPYPADDPDGAGAYACIVAVIRLSDELIEAHQRLSLLPHVDTFPVYKAHVTLAYVKADRAPHWQRTLQELSPIFTVDTSRHPLGLDYGKELS